MTITVLQFKAISFLPMSTQCSHNQIMKILHVIPKLPINSNYTVVGGSANAVINLSRQQKQMGDEVIVLSHFPLTEKNEKEFLQTNGFININISAGQNSKLYGAEFIVKSYFASKPSGKDFDIVHGHSGHIDYLLASKLISRRNKSPLIYSLFCPVTLESKVTHYPMRKEYLETICKNATFIAISENIARSLEQIQCKKRVVVIPPPIDIQRYSNAFDKKALRQRHDFDPKEPVLLFVGNFSKTKNMECVLLAFKKFLGSYPKAKLIVTTELHIAKFSEREAYLHLLINDLHINESLVFMGVTDNMPELMQLSDVLVAPFRDTDGPSDFFLAALESMSVGTPAFVSPAGGMREVINEKTGRFIDPDQPDQLNEELQRFFADRSTGFEMGANASKFIRSHFAPEWIESKIKEVYLEVLKDAG
jgi:L-malate glycosyltransferase